MLIAVVNQKGGVGKSTLAVHLALWLAENAQSVALIDADGQGTSSRWISIAAPGVVVSRPTSPDDILETGRELQQSHDLVIADGPANLAESSRALLLIADIALVPCGPTVPDLESTSETLRILTNAQAVRADGKPLARVVLSRFRSQRFVLSREAREAVAVLGLPICNTTIVQREAIGDAAGQRAAVWNLGRRAGQAAHEMIQLMEEVYDYTSQSTERGRSAHA